MTTESREVLLLVGEIKGALKAHIAETNRDRAERDNDRRDSAEYRKEVRTTLAILSQKVDTIEPLQARVKNIEPVIEDYKTLRIKIATAVIIISGAMTLIIQGLMFFGSDIKAFILRLLRVS
jgi:hypothetical protein